MDNPFSIPTLLSSWLETTDCTVTPLSGGGSCSAYRIDTDTQQFVLRGFPARQQAELEAEISALFLNCNLIPEILPACSGAYYVPYNGLFFNLQRFIPGKRPQLSDDPQIAAAAQSAAQLHKMLSSACTAVLCQDRFQTNHLLQKASDFPLLSHIFPSWAVTTADRERFIQDLEGTLRTDQLIHADLTERNMIWNGCHMHIIDFGECRTGDQHFDLASLVCDILKHAKSEKDFNNRLSLFIGTYETEHHPVNHEKLRLCIYLWLLRGALTSAAFVKDSRQKSSIFTHFLNEINRIYEYYSF